MQLSILEGDGYIIVSGSGISGAISGGELIGAETDKAIVIERVWVSTLANTGTGIMFLHDDDDDNITNKLTPQFFLNGATHILLGIEPEQSESDVYTDFKTRIGKPLKLWTDWATGFSMRIDYRLVR